jgi:hypothetical protein
MHADRVPLPPFQDPAASHIVCPHTDAQIRMDMTMTERMLRLPLSTSSLWMVKMF